MEVRTYTHRDYAYRAHRLLQAARVLSENSDPSFLLIVYSRNFGFDPVSKAILSYLLEGATGYSPFISMQDFDDIALCINVVQGTFSWYFPTQELLNQYRHIISGVLSSYVYIGFTDPLVLKKNSLEGAEDAENTSPYEDPYLSFHVVGCRRYASLTEAACTKGFASKVLEYNDSNNVLDVPLLAFLRDALTPVDAAQLVSPKVTHGSTQIRQDSTDKTCCSLNQSKCASQSTVYSAIEGPAQPGSDPRYREFLESIPSIALKALPVDVLYQCLYHVDACSTHVLYRSMHLLELQCLECVNKSKDLVASVPPGTADIGQMLSSSISEPMVAEFTNKRTHYLDICAAMRAASTADDFFSKTTAVKYYPLTLLAAKTASDTTRALTCGGIIDMNIIHPLYPLQVRRSLIIEPYKATQSSVKDIDGVPSSVIHAFYSIAGAVASQLPELVTLLAEELGLGSKLYAKIDDLAKAVDSSLGPLKNKILSALTTSMQAKNFSVGAATLKQAINLTSNAIKISCEYYNLGMTKVMYGRVLYHINLAIQVRLPYTSSHVLALTIVHGDTLLTHPGGYYCMGSQLLASKNMVVRLRCSDKFVFRDLAMLPVKQHNMTNLACDMRLLHYVAINGKKFLLSPLTKTSFPCLLHFDPGFHLSVWLQNLGDCTLSMTPNPKSQAFLSTKSMYTDSMKDLFRYRPLLATIDGHMSLMLFTRILTSEEHRNVGTAQEEGTGLGSSQLSGSSYENLSAYTENSLMDLSAVVGHSLAGGFAASIDLLARKLKMTVTTAIRLLLVDSMLSSTDALGKLRNLSALYNDCYASLGFVQIYKPTDVTAAYGFKIFKQERGGDFLLSEDDLPQNIVSGEDLLQLIWSMAKSACKEADLPAELQHTAMSVDSMKKLTHTCVLNGLLDEVFSYDTSETTVGSSDVPDVTTKALLEQSSKNAETHNVHFYSSNFAMGTTGVYRSSLSNVFRQGIQAMEAQDTLKLQASMGIHVADKIITHTGSPLDCLDTLCLTKEHAPVSPVTTRSCIFDNDLKLKSNNHVVIISSLGDLSNTLVALFSAALQSELNGSNSSINKIITRSLNERAFLSDLLSVLPNLTNTVIIGQITAESNLSVLLESVGAFVASTHVTTVRHISVSTSAVFNVHCTATEPTVYQLPFNTTFIPAWTKKLVIVTEPGVVPDKTAMSHFGIYSLSGSELSFISASAEPFKAATNAAKKALLLDSLSVNPQPLTDKTVYEISKGCLFSKEQMVICNLTLPANQVTDICSEVTRCIIDDVYARRCDFVTPDKDLFVLFADRPSYLKVDSGAGNRQLYSSKYHIIQQIDSSYTDTMLRRSLGGLRRIITTRQSIKVGLLPKIFTMLLEACDGSETQGNVQVVLNLSNALFLELSTYKNTISVGRYNIDDYSSRRFFPSFLGKVTILSSEPTITFKQPTLNRLFSSFIEEIFRELFLELAPTSLEIKGHGTAADPLAVVEDLNTLSKENISWDLVKKYYSDEKLPSGWYYDGIKYISMDGERSSDRPDKAELMKKFAEELEAKTLRAKGSNKEENPTTREIENDILKLNIRDDSEPESDADGMNVPFIANRAVPDTVDADSSEASRPPRNPIGSIAMALRDGSGQTAKSAVYTKTTIPASRNAAILRPSGSRTTQTQNPKSKLGPK
ncbi:Hypothetical protein GLP15_2232 [Giardia lamblia P15]|uniref:Uncharacterized protein n=1 Tax=Giardia intestinalis (strain P15) TaxID=658858 RepID=E1F755_GIAIA|nr:Hypothetical protein GLP15_2232 [Giardia lamblia P15]